MEKQGNNKGIITAVIVAVVAGFTILLITGKLGKKKNGLIFPDSKNGSGSGSGTASGTVSSWVKESFPLSAGMFGDKIKMLQKKLGVKDDSYFGGETQTAVQKAIGKIMVSESDYNRIVFDPNIQGIQPDGFGGSVSTTISGLDVL